MYPVARFSSNVKLIFGTDNNAYSNRYHRGLFHGKTHGQRKKRVFSMKYRIETQKPNIMRKRLYSETLDMHLNLWISMKTRKCIMKCGNLDNYLLNTKPKFLDSKMGLYLRSLIIEKKRNPDTFKMEYIPGSSTRKNTNKRTKVWEYK